MENNASWKRKWRLILPTAAVLATVVLFFFLYPRYFLSGSWTDEELYHSDGHPEVEQEEPGHGPVTHPAIEPNDFSIRLHPEQHIHRDPRTIGLEWNITRDIRRPDGVAKEVYLINDQFPGPTVELRSGDELLVTIRNQLDNEGVAIHWHGLRVENAMDGVVGLTQCAVKGEFTYRLKVSNDQAGTFWYHSHSELQRADGLFGALVVHRPAQSTSDIQPYDYQNEQVLMVGDWYHRPAEEVLADYTNWENFKIEPAPDSMLLNGVGYFECSMATKAHPLDCKRQNVPHLTLPARTRVRIVNTGALTGLTISTTGFIMTLLEVDGGHAVERVQSQKAGTLYPGERMDVVFERLGHDEYESAWITIALDRENMQFPNMALTPTQQFAIPPLVDNEHIASAHEEPTANSRASDVPRIDLSNLNGSALPAGELPEQSDETILLYASISYLTQYEYRPKGFINHTSWSLSNSSASPLMALDRTAWPTDPAPFVVKAQQGHTIDLVINNIDDKGHPFHLHGHDFYVLAVHRASRVGAYEQYNPFDREKQPAGGPMNVINPIVKDTVYIPSQGYAVLRLWANNPGLWLVHCHVLWHEAVGMNMAIQIGEDPQIRGEAMKKTIAESCAG